MSLGLNQLYNIMTCSAFSSILVTVSMKNKRGKTLKKTKPKKPVILEHAVEKIAEQHEEVIKEAKEKLEAEPAIPKEEIAYTLKEEKEEQPAAYTAVEKEDNLEYVEKVETTAPSEPGYTDPAAIKAGLPRKGYIESKGLLKDAMLEELKKKHEEDTKKEYAERRKKAYEHK